MSHPTWLIPTGMWLQIASLYTEMPKRICLKRELTWLHQPPPKGSSLWKKSLNWQLMLYSTLSIWDCRERRLNLCISMQPGPTTPAQSFREKESCPFSTDRVIPITKILDPMSSPARGQVYRFVHSQTFSAFSMPPVTPLISQWFPHQEA